MEGSSTFFVERLTHFNDTGTNLRPSRGRSAGPDFSPMRNRGKNRQRRGLPPPCGIHPAVLGVPASPSFWPLPRWGHIDGVELPQKIPTSVEVCASIVRALPWHATVPSCRGPCSRRRERRFFRVGPDMEITQPEGQLPKVAWCGGTNRSYSKSDGPNLNLTQAQPRTPREVLRGESPKRVLVSFARSKETPSGKRPRQAGKPNPQVVRRSTSQSALRLPAPLTQGSLWKCAASSQRSVPGGGAGLRLRNWRRSISPKQKSKPVAP